MFGRIRQMAAPVCDQVVRTAGEVCCPDCLVIIEIFVIFIH